MYLYSTTSFFSFDNYSIFWVNSQDFLTPKSKQKDNVYFMKYFHKITEIMQFFFYWNAVTYFFGRHIYFCTFWTTLFRKTLLDFISLLCFYMATFDPGLCSDSLLGCIRYYNIRDVNYNTRCTRRIGTQSAISIFRPTIGLNRGVIEWDREKGVREEILFKCKGY